MTQTTAERREAREIALLSGNEGVICCFCAVWRAPNSSAEAELIEAAVHLARVKNDPDKDVRAASSVWLRAQGWTPHE